MPQAPPPNPENPLARLAAVMDAIREHCPWDKKQTIASIRHLSLEEVHELSEAILDEDPDEIRKELGDVLFHIVYYSRLAREKGWFTLEEVIDGAAEKIIRRHPHVFGDAQLNDEQAVKKSWEEIKLQERGYERSSVLDGVPASLPALLKALRMQEKARGVGFDWPEADPVRDKVSEEWEELQEVVAKPDAHAQREEEFGDLLFALVNYGRFLKVNPEDALEKANRKFRRRFQSMEAQAKAQGTSLSALSLEEMEALWQQAKAEEKRK